MSQYDIVIIDELDAWMDAEHVEPTNGVGGGTNGINGGITLPDGDCVHSEPGMSENLGSDLGTSEVFDGKGSKVDSREKLETDVCEKLHDSSKETQKPRSREAGSENVSDSDNENLHVEQDTREKLEADVHQYANPAGDKGTIGALWEKKMLGFLDRQAAITKSEWAHVHDMYIADLRKERDEAEKRIAELEAELHRSYDAQAAKAEELTLRGVRIAELQKQTKRQAEAIGEWEIRCEALIAERNKWHVRCGKLLDAVHVMLGVTDECDEEV